MSHIVNDSALELYIQDEITLREALRTGARGQAVRRVQEWLSLHGKGLVIDGAFGKVTEATVKQFQRLRDLPQTGIVDSQTYRELVAPLHRVLTAVADFDPEGSFGSLASLYARAHLDEHPREVGGQNRGPWVRLYMRGNEGSPWAWCAGFVTFLMKQAEDTLHMTHAVQGSFSCDSLAAQGKSAGLFVREGSIPDPTDLPEGSIFLVRRTDTDWTHTGLVTRFDRDFFETIEGNTNDDGHREGYEVCARSRGYESKDFIRI